MSQAPAKTLSLLFDLDDLSGPVVAAEPFQPRTQGVAASFDLLGGVRVLPFAIVDERSSSAAFSFFLN